MTIVQEVNTHILKPLPSGPVAVSANTPNKPFIFRVDSEPNYVALLMPWRLA